MAVYNGQSFVGQQLDSIISQKYRDWEVYIRDDASSDDSPAIVENFAKEYSRVHTIKNATGNMGARKSFISLLESDDTGSYSYIAFSDQDDVWLQDKLLRQLEKMHELESRFPNCPLLVHSDMEVVNTFLDVISPSLMEFQGIQHEEIAPLKVLLAQNFVTGCTVLVNRKLLDIALPVPDEVLMHDWWLALCAATFGRIGYIDKPLLKYRQHGNNEVGAKHVNDFLNPFTSQWKKRWREGGKNLFQSMKQAQVLAARIRECDPDNPHRALVDAYALLPEKTPLQRISEIRRLGVHAQEPMRQALLLSRLLLTQKY